MNLVEFIVGLFRRKPKPGINRDVANAILKRAFIEVQQAHMEDHPLFKMLRKGK